MKKLAILSVGLLAIPVVAFAVPAPKYFVCKFVGTPGVNETLQTGNNPISVSGNALPDGVEVGESFSDQHGRSFVLAEDVGQDEPDVSECVVTPNEPETPEEPETPVVDTPETPITNEPVEEIQGK